ncbi:MAG: type VI secretion system contractile sheath large subunit [Thermodesulfobacteriota bacterium]
MEVPLIPFKILALAPFGPVPESGAKPRIVPVDLASLDEAVQAVAPRFYLPVDKDLCPEGGLTIEIKSLKDFKPEALVRNTPFLSRVEEARRFAREASTGGASPRDTAPQIRSRWPEVPLNLGAGPAALEAKTSSRVDDILAMVALPGGGDAPPAGLTRAGGPFEQLEALLSALLEAVYDNEEFRTYEASWRGLDALLRQGPIKEGQPVRVNLVSINPDDLAETLDQLVTELALDLPGLVLLDAPLDAGARSTALFEAIAGFAENLLAPTAVWITPHFFHLEDWAGLGRISYLKHHLEDAAYAKWRKLPEHPGSNWLTVTCNRFLTRFPYGDDHKPKTAFFKEGRPLWLSPVWALGALAAQSVLAYGWPSRFTDYTHVALRDLTVIKGAGEGPAATEMTLSEDRLMEFIEAGITPLLGPVRKDTAFMPKEATLAGGSLKYQLFTSRVLGFLFWCRDNLYGEVREGDVARNLQRAFSLFWEKTGHPAPEDLEITMGQETESGTIPLGIALTPPRAVLPGGQRLEFSFVW